MKIQSISTTDKNYYQNKPNFKAYFEPNANFHNLYSRDMRDSLSSINAEYVKKLKELPNHCLEILQLKKIPNTFSNNIYEPEHITDSTECIILNKTTKQSASIVIENNIFPFSTLMKKVIELKDKRFFQEQGLLSDMLYEALTTPKPLDETIAKLIDE